MDGEAGVFQPLADGELEIVHGSEVLRFGVDEGRGLPRFDPEGILARLAVPRYFRAISTVQEIKTAIQNLSPAEWEELLAELPTLLPELDGDVAWERIIHDPSPRPALSTLGDEIEAELRRNPETFPEITEADFERNS